MATNTKNRYKPVFNSKVKLPLFLSPVSAGTFSPADDYIEKKLDLNEYCVKNEPATFYCPIKGDSMIGAGIFSGDLAVVDKSLKPINGDVIVGFLNGDFICKRLKLVKKTVYLVPENPKYKTIEVSPDSDFEIWGVVTRSIRSHRP